LLTLSCARHGGDTSRQPRQGWPFRTEGEIFSLPSCDARNIYFGSCDGNFYCVDKTTGALNWKRKGYRRIDSDPIVVSNTAYFASIDNHLNALSARDGKTLWTTTISGSGYSNPKLYNGRLLISGADQLVELSPENGKFTHQYRLSGEVADFDWNSEGIAVVVNRDISSNDYRGRGEVCFFKHGDDRPVWKRDLGATCLGRLDCDEVNCYLGTRDGVFRAINVRNGTIAWQIDCSQLFTRKSGVVWADDYVMTTTDRVLFTASHQNIGSPSLIVCARKTDGTVLWTAEHPTQICGSFVLIDANVVCISEGRNLLCVDVRSGASRVGHVLPQPGRGEFAGVVHDGDYLFLVGADTNVRRLHVDAVLGEVGDQQEEAQQDKSSVRGYPRR
jgi:outer membrane protein assembly factor BamB